MESGMLNSLHNEEEQFTIGGSISRDTSPQWSGGTAGHGSHLSPQSEEGGGEDFDRTLSDWRRHLASLPMSDSEDYIKSDVLNDSPSPCKADKFSFSPDSLSAHSNADRLSIKPENIININAIHSGTVRGDNRMMDNDNTSGSGNFYATIDSVIYELDTDPNEKYTELDHDYVSNTIQVISVNPNNTDLSDTSSEGSSRCSSPGNEYSSEYECQDVHTADQEIEYCIQPEDTVELEQETVPIESILNNTFTEDMVHERSDVKDTSEEVIQINSIKDCIGYKDSPSALLSCNVTPESNLSKRQKLKSVSLPQSPSHGVEIPGLDFQTSMTFEDLKMIDFDRMFSISPSKAFNKHFDMPDVFDDNVQSFSEIVSFDPIVDLKPKRDSDVSTKTLQFNDSKTAQDINGIIEKNSMIEKVMNSSDLLFNPKMEDCDLVEDLNNFDLPSFIMGESNLDPAGFLKENFISSPIVPKKEYVSVDIKNDFVESIETFENDLSRLPNVMSTPKQKSKPSIYSQIRILSPKETPFDTPDVDNSKITLKNCPPGKYPPEPVILQIPKSECFKTPCKDDSEDYIDVETVSDGENFPVLAANNLNSLLEQFEATENISKQINSLAEAKMKVEAESFEEAEVRWSVKKEEKSFSNGWSLPGKVLHSKKFGVLRTPERKHYGINSEISSIVSPCLTKSVLNSSTESVQLDHDYCSPVRHTKHSRTVSESTDCDSETKRRDSSFISPQATSIASFYKKINSCNRKLGLGKGKNIAMCMEQRTDEFRESNIHSIKKSSGESLLKVNEVSPSGVRSDLSDSDCSMSDHSYSKTDSFIKSESFAPVNKIKISNLTKCVQIPRKVEVTETVVDISCEKDIKKTVIVKLQAEIDNPSKVHKLISKNPKVNKNSLLLTNFKNISDVVKQSPRSVLHIDHEKSLLKPKQSLLKPIVKNDVKKVSLLKSNYVKNHVPAIVKEPLVEVINAIEPVSASNNEPLLIVTPPKTEDVLAVEVVSPAENYIEVIKPIEAKQPMKRKLNLEEYKKRREGTTRSCETSRTSSPIAAVLDNWAFSSPNSPAPSPNLDSSTTKNTPSSEHTPSLTEMLQNVLSNPVHGVLEASPEKVEIKKDVPVEPESKLYDPIAEASKKAIQLKKLAAKRCNEDKIIQKKIPKLENLVILPIVTENGKVLPMTKSIDKDVEVSVGVPTVAPVRRKNSEYEEIVMVSVGVNTNPVIFQDPETYPKVDEVSPTDDAAKNGIQFTIKKKSNALMQKNVFDSISVSTVVPVKVTDQSNSLSTNIAPLPAQLANGKEKAVRESSKTWPRSEVNKSNIVSAEVLSNLNATLQKVEQRKDIRITSNSLLASIQKVVRKKNSANRSPDLGKESSHHSSERAKHSDRDKQDYNRRSDNAKKSNEKSRHVGNVDQVNNSNSTKGNIKQPMSNSSSDLSKSQKPISKSPLLQFSKSPLSINTSPLALTTSPLISPSVAKSPLVSSKSPSLSSISPALSDSAKETDVTLTQSAPHNAEQAPTIDHGEDKVIMHLRKDRTRPEMSSLSVQTDGNVIIQDIVDETPLCINAVPDEITPDAEHEIDKPAVVEMDVTLCMEDGEIDCKADEHNEINELTQNENGTNRDKAERTYRKHKESISSEASNDHEISKPRDTRGRGYSTSSRRTNSIDRHRNSYSPVRGRYRSRSPRRWNNKNRNYRSNYRNRDNRYSRRSRSISRDKRRRYNSRDRNSRAYSSNRQDRRLSRSSGYNRDNRSVRSVPSTSKRRRISSRSRSPNAKCKARDSSDRRSSSKRSISRSEENHPAVRKDSLKNVESTNSTVSNGVNGTRRRKSTERSTRSHSQSSSSSNDSRSSSSSSSSCSSSSSGSSYNSDSSVFHSAHETKSVKSCRFENSESGSLRPPLIRKAEPIEERRVVFIGRLEQDITKEDLRRKFVKYGHVVEVTLHRKDDGTRYGFVTFSKAEQSYKVVERANSDPDLNPYDVSFGGRRAFCRHLYADLDDLETLEDIDYYGGVVRRSPLHPRTENSFDSLLEQMRLAVEAKRARQRECSKV